MAWMSVLSIQSRVASGYVGNSAAVPCLQRLGFDVVAVDTVVLSNHPAHSRFRGTRRSAAEIADLLTGVAELRGLAGLQAVLSGYLGGVETGSIVIETVDAIKAAAPQALYCLDPVMGDNDRLYVDAALVAFFRGPVLARADIVTPNAFEAGVLLDTPTVTMETARTALEALRQRGPDAAVITGIVEGGGRSITSVGADSRGSWRVSVPRIEAPESGAGDAFTAILLGRMLGSGGDLAASLGHAAASVHAILRATVDRGLSDLALAAALDQVARPSQLFPVTPLG